MAQQTFEELVAAVKQAESRGKRYADNGKLTTSPKGALGEMQVMPKTITDPGFGVAPAKDKSPDEIARVGRDYLQAMVGKYGDTEKALVAYNWGPGSADKWIAAGAKPEALPEETRTYVQRVKGFLGGKDVSRETMAKKEPTPAEEMMTKALPAGTTAQAMPKDNLKIDVKSMPPSYQAAFALAALADAQDAEDDKAFNENKSTETEKFFAEHKPVNHLASLELDVKPVMMNEGGEARKDEPFFDAASRTFVDVLTGRREPITEKDFTAREQLAMMDAVKRSQARGGKGRVDYQDYPSGEQIGPGFVDIRNTLGGFQYKQMPDGTTVITDRYDFHGPRAKEYEQMGTGEKVFKSAKNALSAFIQSGGGVRDAAGELGDAWIGKNGPPVTIRIPPVKRADGGDAEPTAEELAAASRPATVNPNIRKQGEAARKLAAMRDVNTLPDPKTYAAVSGLLGTPPDEMGFSVMHPKAAEIRAVANPAFAVGTALGVAPALQVMGAGKVAEKTGEAAKMLARDFQQYNQQLDVPGASYAIRNRGTPFLGTPAQVNFEGKVLRPAMSEADDYADWLSRTFAHGEPALKTWLKDKVGAYLRRDFGTESDQMVQAADQGKKLHFMSPKLTENVPHQLGTDIGLSRELEGFPKSGFAKTPQGQKVEEVIDSTIYPLQLQDITASYQVPKSMEQFVGTNPEMRVSQMGPIDENLKFDELAQAMEKMFKEKEFRAYGESVPMPKEYVLTDETLQGLTPAQASNRVANKMAWVEKKRGELAGVAIAKDPQIVSHSYDNGSKWISPGDLADHPNHANMVKDIGCAGGWCTDKDTFAMDYGSGENRLNILLDKKFEPRVQLTVNSPPTTVREFILANPHLPEIDAIASNRTITAREVDQIIKAMPEYIDFVKQNQNVKNITEIKGQFNNADLRDSPYLKQVQDFVKRQGPDLQSVYNLDGIDMLDMRVELPSMRQYGKGNYSQGLLEKLLQVNGNSYFAGKDEFPDLIKKAYELPNNAARQIQMNMFQLPTERASGGMIERQPTDNRRYL